MEENIENQESELINWKSIIIGSIIIFVGFLIVFGGFLQFVLNLSPDDLFIIATYYLVPIIAGFTVAYINKPIYKAGIINGVLATLIGYILINLLAFFIEVFRGIPLHNTSYIIFGRVLIFLAILIPVFLGSFVGTSVKKLKIRINNRQIKA